MNNIPKEQIVFLGNSNNDEWAYESGCRTVVVNPKWTDPNNKKRWNYDIQGELSDFTMVLPYILPTKFF